MNALSSSKSAPRMTRGKQALCALHRSHDEKVLLRVTTHPGRDRGLFGIGPVFVPTLALESSRPLGGRPQIETKLRVLIRRMSVAKSCFWGAPRIHGGTAQAWV